MSYTWGAWLWGGAPLTGSQLDSMRRSCRRPVKDEDADTVVVAGPKRPPPPKEPPPPKKPLITWGEPPKPEAKVEDPKQPAAVKRTAVKKQREQARVAGERKDVYVDVADSVDGNMTDVR